MNELESYETLVETRKWLDEKSQPFIDKLNNGTALDDDRKMLVELQGRYLHLRKEITKRLE